WINPSPPTVNSQRPARPKPSVRGLGPSWRGVAALLAGPLVCPSSRASSAACNPALERDGVGSACLAPAVEQQHRPQRRGLGLALAAGALTRLWRGVASGRHSE